MRFFIIPHKLIYNERINDSCYDHKTKDGKSPPPPPNAKKQKKTKKKQKKQQTQTESAVFFVYSYLLFCSVLPQNYFQTFCDRSSCANPFILEFLKWTLPSLNLVQIGVSVKNQNRIANHVDPDETAHDEPSHQDLQCLQKRCFGLRDLKG